MSLKEKTKIHFLKYIVILLVCMCVTLLILYAKTAGRNWMKFDEGKRNTYFILTKLTERLSLPNVFWAIATLASSLLCLSCGLANGISAVLLPKLVDDEEFYWEPWYGSWMAAVAPLSSVFGCLCMTLLDCFGRKSMQVGLAFPFLVGWITMACADNFYVMLAGRFVTGFSFGAVRPVTVIYLGEISDSKYRGIILLFPSLALNLGVLFSHVLGTFLNWRIGLLICVVPNFILFSIILFFKESPYWLISKGRIEEGIECFRWFRGTGDRAESELHGLLERQGTGSSLTFKELVAIVSSRSFLKPIITMFFIFSTVQMCGVNAFPFYAKDLLEAMFEKDVDTFLLMVVIDLIRVAVCTVICLFGKTMHRKTTYVACAYATTLILCGLVVFLTFDTDISLVAIPVTLLVFYTAVASAQASLGWTFVAELFPTNVRGLGSGLSGAISFALLSLCVKIIPDLLACGEPVMYGTFAIITLVGTVILNFILPETNGKLLQEIEDSYNNENKTTKL